MNAQQLPSLRSAGLKIADDRTILHAFQKSHVGEAGVMPLGIVKPRDEHQIESLMAWATKHKVPLVPVSSPDGPRRRGDTAPAVPALIVDLSLMNRLIHADGRDAIAIIEPGLSFPQFDDALRPYGLRSFKPLLPRRTKSVLTTYLEREPMIVPRDHWDTTDPLAGLSITFGNGEVFRTGGASLPGGLTKNLALGNRQMMAAGPIMTDYTRLLMGSQGTLGIVSWASIYCERIPAREKSAFYGADNYAAVAEFARLLALRQLGSECFILDRTQAAAALGFIGDAFESAVTGNAAPRWLLFVTVVAPDALPDACIAWQEAGLADLAKLADVKIVDDMTGYRADALAQRLHDLPATYYKDAPLGAHREVFCLSQLDRAESLLTAVAPLLAEAHQVAGIVTGAYIQPTIQGSSCHLEFTLFHDPAMTALAAQFDQRIVERLVEAGGFLSRPYANWSDVAFRRDPAIVPYLCKVKDMFDPERLLNPNRLCF